MQDTYHKLTGSLYGFIARRIRDKFVIVQRLVHRFLLYTTMPLCCTESKTDNPLFYALQK